MQVAIVMATLETGNEMTTGSVAGGKTLGEEQSVKNFPRRAMMTIVIAFENKGGLDLNESWKNLIGDNLKGMKTVELAFVELTYQFTGADQSIGYGIVADVAALSPSEMFGYPGVVFVASGKAMDNQQQHVVTLQGAEATTKQIQPISGRDVQSSLLLSCTAGLKVSLTIGIDYKGTLMVRKKFSKSASTI
jgi:hypothetical protein